MGGPRVTVIDGEDSDTARNRPRHMVPGAVGESSKQPWLRHGLAASVEPDRRGKRLRTTSLGVDVWRRTTNTH